MRTDVCEQEPALPTAHCWSRRSHVEESEKTHFARAQAGSRSRGGRRGLRGPLRGQENPSLQGGGEEGREKSRQQPEESRAPIGPLGWLSTDINSCNGCRTLIN